MPLTAYNTFTRMGHACGAIQRTVFIFVAMKAAPVAKHRPTTRNVTHIFVRAASGLALADIEGVLVVSTHRLGWFATFHFNRELRREHGAITWITEDRVQIRLTIADRAGVLANA